MVKLLGNLLGGRNLLGIDVGASAIKVLQGSASGKSFLVEKCIIVPLPYKAIDERGISNPQAVANALSTAFQAIGASKVEVATSLHGQGVLTKRIALSKQLPKKEIPNQVRWEAEQYFPVDVTSILVDHVMLGDKAQIPGEPPGTYGWDVLLVGVRHDDAKVLRDLIEANIGPVKVMDLESFASGDFLERFAQPDPNEAVAFVDIGASGTRVHVRHQKRVTFLREFYIGGQSFTDAIAQTLGLAPDDAEALKIGSNSGLPAEALAAIGEVLSSWKAELQQCEDVFVTQEADTFVSRWLLFGGGTNTPGLSEALNDERFAGKIALLPMDNYFTAKSSSVDAAVLASWANRLATAAGLCMRGKG